ncbi:MAG: cytochrome c3 family protein [Thermoguttaceae bacterium]|jgi:predicted CXXCH cytochrome family protein
MKTLLTTLLSIMPLAALALASQNRAGSPQPPTQENYCIECHSNGDVWDKSQQRYFITAKNFAGDVHWQKGLRCTDCHGGDPTNPDVAAAHSKDAGFKAVKSPADVPAFCGNCHANIEYMKHYQASPRSDQLAEYWTSGHGKALKATGDPKVATCVSCHGKPHGSAEDPNNQGIRAVSDLESPVYHTRVAKTCAKCHADAKVMTGYQYHGRPLGHEQYAEWRSSVHGRALMDKGDLSAPTCNNCHGNHGAVPPAVGSVANACGACHGKIANLFADTRMKHRFGEKSLPGCATCHNSHNIQLPSDKMVGMRDGAVCMKCHENGKYGATLAGANAAREIRQGLDQLNQRIATAETTLAKAERLGMEVSAPKFELRNAVNALTNARTLLHSFAVKPVQAALADGEKAAVEVQGKADHALQEYTDRRIWLAGSLVPILIVIGMLLLYIRSLPAAK